MSNRRAMPTTARVRRILSTIGKPPQTYSKLCYTRCYTLKYGMRAAKLTAVIDCIKALRQQSTMPLP